MAIRADDPTPASQSMVLLVEDCGLRAFLLQVLPLTSLDDHDVHVVGGKGWTATYQTHDRLVDSGVHPARIVPVLDGDTLGEKGPHSAIHRNSRVFRFQFDVEFAFATSECLLLDHALLLLLPHAFGEYGSVAAIESWRRVIEQAYWRTAEPSGEPQPILDNVEAIAKAEFAKRGQPPEGLSMPSKVELAKTLAKLCIASGALPRELAELLWTVEAYLGNRPYRRGTGAYGPRPLWASPLKRLLPRPAPALQGKALFSPNGIGLAVADLSAGGAMTAIPDAGDLGWGAWTPDGRIVATCANADGVALTTADNAKERQLLRHGVRESFLCWNAPDQRVLLQDGNARIFSVSQDNSSWTRIDAPGYGHCISRKGHLAWTTDQYRIINVRRLHDAGATPSRVRDVIDARHSLAWSHSGEELAFINAAANNTRRTICIWNGNSQSTRFIAPWIGQPRSLAWSPDDKHLLLQLEEAEGLFLIEAHDAPAQSICELFRATAQGGLLKCGAWRG